jgi:hypothetical protein
VLDMNLGIVTIALDGSKRLAEAKTSSAKLD